jgi:hypothetical protein
MANENKSNGGIGLGVILFLIFMTLKLTGNIDWSWWWVTSPLWIPFVAAAVILGIVGVIAIIIEYINHK